MEKNIVALFLCLLFIFVVSNSYSDDVYIDGAPMGNKIEKIEYDIDGNTEYFGFAMPNTSTTNGAFWQIFKITTTDGDWEILWCDGDANYDNFWVSRSTLIYK